MIADLRSLLLITLFSITACSVGKPIKPSISPTKPQEEQAKITDNIPAEDKKAIKEALLATNVTDVERLLAKISSKSSFSFKDESGQTPTDVLIELQDIDKLNAFIANGLSIYSASQAHLDQILLQDLQEAKYYLERTNKNRKQQQLEGFALNLFDLHRKNIESILNLLGKQNFPEALMTAKRLNLSCNTLSISLSFHSMTNYSRIPTANIVKFLNQSNCQSSITSKDIKPLLQLEARRQVQDKFEDIDLYMYLLGHPSLYDKMIEVGSYGVKVSTSYLIQLSLQCPFDTRLIEQTDKNKPLFYDVFSGDCILKTDRPLKAKIGKCDFNLPELNKCLEQNYQYKASNFDFVVLKNNKRVIANFDTELDPKLNAQILASLYGYNDSEDEWDYALSYIFNPELPEMEQDTI